VNVIEADQLVRYGDLTAVDSVAFDARQGEIFGFLGSKGAEKTTTKNMQCTLLHRPLDVPV
jgi:ABC-type multidrug transport system ATPase subunit